MSGPIVRSKSSNKYSENWESAFGSKKAKAAKAPRKSAPKKTAKKKGR
jgi:hypothetical protein